MGAMTKFTSTAAWTDCRGVRRSSREPVNSQAAIHVPLPPGPLTGCPSKTYGISRTPSPPMLQQGAAAHPKKRNSAKGNFSNNAEELRTPRERAECSQAMRICEKALNRMALGDVKCPQEVGGLAAYAPTAPPAYMMPRPRFLPFAQIIPPPGLELQEWPSALDSTVSEISAGACADAIVEQVRPPNCDLPPGVNIPIARAASQPHRPISPPPGDLDFGTFGRRSSEGDRRADSKAARTAPQRTPERRKSQGCLTDNLSKPDAVQSERQRKNLIDFPPARFCGAFSELTDWKSASTNGSSHVFDPSSTDGGDSPDNVKEELLDVAMQVSTGSWGHPRSCAEACRYVKRKGGCREGDNCRRCHLCFWRRPGDDAESASAFGEEADVSVGTVGHPHRCGLPCKYARRKGGCRDGAKCKNCHACLWQRVRGDAEIGAKGKESSKEPASLNIFEDSSKDLRTAIANLFASHLN